MRAREARRETRDEIFILACKRQGPTEQVVRSGLPDGAKDTKVLFEPPQRVPVENGCFTDWFAEAHICRTIPNRRDITRE